jgi:hypothetical protein
MVAGAAHQVMESGAFAAEDEDAVSGQVELVVIGVRDAIVAGVKADDPQVLTLELFEGAHQIDHAGDAEVLGGAGAGFDGNGAEGSGTAFGEDDAVDAGSVGNAEESAEVLRIFNAVKGKNQAPGAGLGEVGGEEVFNGEELLGADQGDNALVRGSFGEEGELLAGLDARADTGVAAKCNHMIEAGIVAFACQQDVVETAAAGLERFLHGMHSVQNFHEG